VTALVAALFGVLIAGLGLVGLFSPSALLEFAARWQTRGALLLAGILRVIFGASLVLAAPGSRAPMAFLVLGVLTVVAGLATPLVGVERFAAILDWWRGRGSGTMRAWAFVAMLFGLLVVYGVLP
jgi:hypothetical protein